MLPYSLYLANSKNYEAFHFLVYPPSEPLWNFLFRKSEIGDVEVGINKHSMNLSALNLFFNAV
jgi:hypothetical protein